MSRINPSDARVDINSLAVSFKPGEDESFEVGVSLPNLRILRV